MKYTIRDFVPDEIMNMSEPEYRSTAAINKSTLWQLKKSPAHYKWTLEHPSPDTPALCFGRACHMAILQPNEFKEHYVLAPDFDRRTKAGKEAFQAFMDANGGREILSVQDYEDIQGMSNAILNVPETAGMLEPSDHEVPLFWVDDTTGLLCKCRLDAVERTGKLSYTIRDLKTATDASTATFLKEALRYGYDVQAAHYIRGLKALTGATKVDWEFVVVEKKPPYGVNVVRVGDDFIDRGTWQLIDLMDRLKECVDLDSWPSYGANDLILPDWAAIPDDD